VGSQLTADRMLTYPQYLLSPNKFYRLVMQSDGNLVLYRAGQQRALWSTRTDKNPGAWAIMQSDGNLVVYSDEDRPLWASGTQGHPGAYLVVQDDGNCVIYSRGGRALWNSNTAR
jgi:hypothetical protein